MEGKRMKLALIPPFQFLDDVFVTNTQMMLPHLISHESYANRYRGFGELNSQFVIMDNGAAEDESIKDTELVAKAIEFRVDEVVAPDYLGESDFTVAKTIAFIQYCRGKYAGAHTPIGIVAQGVDAIDALWCIMEILNKESDAISTIYIPRLLVKGYYDLTRLRIAAKVSMHYPDKNIHFLGASAKWPGEIIEAARSGIVRSIDTSMPYMYAKLGMELDKESPFIPTRGNDGFYFTRLWSTLETDLAKKNVDTILRWVNEKA